MTIVYTLSISHRYGCNLSVHETELGANIALASYCRNEWESEVGPDVAIPTEPGDVISRYFEAVDNESADIEQQDLLDDAASETLYAPVASA